MYLGTHTNTHAHTKIQTYSHTDKRGSQIQSLRWGRHRSTVALQVFYISGTGGEDMKTDTRRQDLCI